jgi:hypothetical protein
VFEAVVEAGNRLNSQVVPIFVHPMLNLLTIKLPRLDSALARFLAQAGFGRDWIFGMPRRQSCASIQRIGFRSLSLKMQPLSSSNFLKFRLIQREGNTLGLANPVLGMV